LLADIFADVLTNLGSKNSRANKLLSILHKDVSLKTYSIINQHTKQLTIDQLVA